MADAAAATTGGAAGGAAGASSSGSSGASGASSESGSAAAESTSTAAAQAGGESEAREAANTNAEPEPWRKAKHRVKADGQDLEVDYDELLAGYQRSRSFTRKTQELAEQRKQIEQTLAELDTDPGAALRKRGPAAIKRALMSLFDADDPQAQQAVAETFDELVERSKLSPEERRRKDLEAEIAELEARKQKTEEQTRQQQQAELAEKMQAKLVPAFGKALGAVGLPQNAVTIGRIAGAFEALIDAGEKPNADTLREAAATVREEIEGELRALLGGLDGGALEQFLGDEPVKRLAEHRIARVRGGAQQQADKPKPPPRREPEEPQWIDPDELRERREERRRRRGA